MSTELLRLIEAELARRSAILDDLFPEQRALVEDRSRFRFISTNRRAGKSHAAVVSTIMTMLSNDNSQSHYIARNIPAAKSIALPMFSELNQKYDLGLKIREARNLIKYPNGSITMVFGSDAPEAVQSIRGIKNYRHCVIDEAGFIRLDLKRYIDTVLRPALADCKGTLILATTPSESKASYAYKIYKDRLSGWAIHEWNAFSNPHTCKQVKEEMDAILAETPAAADAAYFQREWLGRWVFDDSSLVYGFDDSMLVDDYRVTASDRIVVGIDFGFSPDATAFTAVAWNEHSPKCVVLESYKSSEMNIGEIAKRARDFLARYPRAQLVGDHSNKAVFQELQQRYRVPIMPSYKMEKAAMIEFFNTDAKSGNVSLVRNATKQLTAEMHELTWVERGEKRIEDPGAHNDACDAMLYAYRLSRHFRANPKPREEPKTRAQLLDADAERAWREANKPPEQVEW